MLVGRTSYTFGVFGYWVVAGDRHGAHNWEATGLWSAETAVTALRQAIQALKAHASCDSEDLSGDGRPGLACMPLPDPYRLLLTGHSMGGHGAWLAAVRYRDRYASW